MELRSFPGPPKVKNYSGKRLLKPSKKTYTIELDAGSLWAIWEMVEAKAKNPIEAYDAFRRAVPALRAAYWNDHLNELPRVVEVKVVARRPRK